MNKVFLHIGSHKTGTTAIQSFASDNANWLRRRGLLYPSFDLIGGSRERSHLRMVDRIVSQNALSFNEHPVSLLNEAQRIAKHESLDILLSAESLFRLSTTDALSVMETLKFAFQDLDFIVVCSLRNRAEFIESLYRNGYRAFKRVPKEFEYWFKNARSNLEFERIILSYTRGLDGKSLLLPYGSSSRKNFVSFFFQKLGVNIKTASTSAKEKNPSLDLIDCLAKKIVMNGQCNSQLSKAYNNFAFQNRISSEYGFLSYDLEEELAQQFAEEDARLIQLEPCLSEVFDRNVMRMSWRPIDDSCLTLAKERADTFKARRKNRIK